MSYVTYKNKTQGINTEIYHNEDDYETQPGYNTNRQQQQNAGREFKSISSRSVSVCLVVLCVLLLTAVIVLCVLIYTNNHQSHKTELQMLSSEADGWMYYKSSLYFISSEKRGWTESRRYCRDRGADLIIINNTEKQDFVEKISGSEFIWIGLSDSDVEGTWKWVDGSTMNTEFWAPGEPNGHKTENCVVSLSSEWHDYPCTNTAKWICKKSIK